MPDVHVPLLGDVPKGAVVAGGLAAVGVAGYLIYKRLKKPATPPATATPPTAAAGYGYGYGYGGYSPYGYGGFGGGGFPFTNPFGPPPNPFGYGGPPTTNAQWGQDAEAALGSTGSDAIAAALGAYLVGKPVTQQQETTVNEAIAVEGYPPQAGPNNYPPQIHVVGGGGTGGTIPVPNVVGQETDAAMRALTAVGLVGSHPKLQAGHGSVVTAENPSAGTQVQTGSTVQLSIKEK